MKLIIYFMCIYIDVALQVGLITSVGSGLPIGKEVSDLINNLFNLLPWLVYFKGPFVHMSSILAHQMSRFITNINKVYVVSLCAQY